MSNSKKMFMETLRAVSTRLGLAARLGRSYDGDRDVYSALGYPTQISYEDYFGKFTRQDIAKRIVTAPVNATWRGVPQIVEDPTPGVETEFEKAWSDLEKQHKIFHYLRRADRVSGIGRYGCLFLGISGTTSLEAPLKAGKTEKKLLYLAPYSEDNAEVHTWNSNPRDERFSLPELYRLNQAEGIDIASTKSINVHHSRVLHIAEGLTEDDVFGTPRLEAVWNRLMNLELLSGGSAEMFWRGAFPGMGFEADADADFDEQSKIDLDAEIEKYVHGLKRYFKMQGVSAKQMSVQIADPSKHFDLQIKLISAATGIPARILVGSESGELASSQDERNWNATIIERRSDFAEPIILRPFIDKMIEIGILPEPTKYDVKWPDIYSPSEADQSSINKRNAESLAVYSNAPNAQRLVPPKQFLQKVMGYSPEEVQDVPDILPEVEVEQDSFAEADLDRDGNEKKRDGSEA